MYVHPMNVFVVIESFFFVLFFFFVLPMDMTGRLETRKKYVENTQEQGKGSNGPRTHQSNLLTRKWSGDISEQCVHCPTV